MAAIQQPGPETGGEGQNDDQEAESAERQPHLHQAVEPAEDKYARQQWGRDVEFLLSAISYGVGFGNVWRFPYLVYRYGGGVFLIPFFFFSSMVALPLMAMETTMAQYSGLGPFHIYAQVCPALRGCGPIAVYISYFSSIQYVILLSLVIRYTATSFTRELPWMMCDPTFSHDGCYGRCRGEDPNLKFVVINKECRPGGEFCSDTGQGTVSCSNNGQDLTIQDPAFSFFYDRVISMRHPDGSLATFTHYGYVVPMIFGCMIAAYAIAGLVLEKGVSTAGKVAYFTAIFPYFGLIVLLIRAALLPGFTTGIKFYLVPDISKLWSFEVWYQALSQVFFSLGVGYGGLMTLASYNNFYNKSLFRFCIINTTINTCTSLLAGFVVFGSLGYIAHISGQTVEQVAGSGISLTFVTIPTTLGLLPFPQVWCILFFSMLISLGLGSQMCEMETQITCILDTFPKLRAYKSFVTLLVCIIGGCGAFLMTFQGGFWLNATINDFANSAPVLILAFGNVITFIYIYGYQKVIDHLEEMTMRKLRKCTKRYMILTWKFLSPVFILFLIVYFFIDFRGSQYDKPAEPRPYEWWMQMVGVFIGGLPITFIPIGMVIQYLEFSWKYPQLERWDKLKMMFRPHPNYMSQIKKKEMQQYGFLEMIQPTHPTQYSVPQGIVEKIEAGRGSRVSRFTKTWAPHGNHGTHPTDSGHDDGNGGRRPNDAVETAGRALSMNPNP